MTVIKDGSLWNAVSHKGETSASNDKTSISILHNGLLLIVEMDYGRNNLQVEALRKHSPKELIHTLMDIFEELYKENINYVHIESFSKRRWQILDRLGCVGEERDGRYHRYFRLKGKYERC